MIIGAVEWNENNWHVAQSQALAKAAWKLTHEIEDIIPNLAPVVLARIGGRNKVAQIRKDILRAVHSDDKDALARSWAHARGIKRYVQPVVQQNYRPTAYTQQTDDND